VQQGFGSHFGLGLATAARWQSHRKDRTFARLARHGHVAAHHARKLAREGKAEPRPTEALRGLLPALCWPYQRRAPIPRSHRRLVEARVMPFPIRTKQIKRQDEPLITTILRRFQIVLSYSFLQLQERV
jgi:hypothetical protein